MILRSYHATPGPPGIRSHLAYLCKSSAVGDFFLGASRLFFFHLLVLVRLNLNNANTPFPFRHAAREITRAHTHTNTRHQSATGASCDSSNSACVHSPRTRVLSSLGRPNTTAHATARRINANDKTVIQYDADVRREGLGRYRCVALPPSSVLRGRRERDARAGAA